MKSILERDLREIKDNGLYKGEQIITSPQGPEVITLKGSQVNLCSNNYLGLANHPDVLKAVIDGVQNHCAP